MEHEYKVDRTGWSRGPWDNEPDRIEWRHAGLPCLIVRSDTTGGLCGYVAVPNGHPCSNGMSDLDDLRVHGGVTYTCLGCAGPICHVPQDDESTDIFWIGFDCSHAGDLAPYRLRDGSVYRDVAYVRREVESLAKQLVAYAVESGRSE